MEGVPGAEQLERLSQQVRTAAERMILITVFITTSYEEGGYLLFPEKLKIYFLEKIEGRMALLRIKMRGKREG